MLNYLKRIFFIAVIPLMLIGCDKPSDDAIVLDGLANLDFDCFEGQNEYYLEGIIGYDSVCIYDGENGYKTYFGIGNGFVTLTPYFVLGDTANQGSMSVVDMGFYKRSEITDLLDEIRIIGPPQKFGTPLDSMVRAFLTKGIHLIREKVNEDSISFEGFELLINKWYSNPDVDPEPKSIAMTSVLGEQPPESNLTIRDISLETNGKIVEGYISFEIKCKLFLTNASVRLNSTFAKNFSGSFRLPIYYEIE